MTNLEASEVWRELRQRLDGILVGSSDQVALMATVACELHQAFERFHWTGFYRVVAPELLRIGPYQGSHGCLEITFDRGVCGAAARTLETQRVDDVHAFPGHIACSATTRSEIVVPITDPQGRLLAVLDIDSDLPAAFTPADQRELEELARWMGERWGPGSSSV